MPDSSHTNCPACGHPAADGAFCDQCGAELPRIPREEDSGEYPKETMGGQTEVHPPSEEAHHTPTADEVEEGLHERLARENRCPEIAIEFDESREFVEGQASSFRFRLKCRSQEARECDDVRIRVRNPLDRENVPEKRVHGLYRGQPHEVGISYRPSTSGFEIDSEVILTYRLKGEHKEYRGSFAWNCLENGRRRSDGAVVNLNVGDITSDRAADLQLLQNLKIDARREPPSHPIRSGGHRWVPVPLFPSEPAAAPGPRAASTSRDLPPTPEAVTLHDDASGRRIHFFRLDELTAGRSRRSCSFALYRFHPEGTVDEHSTLCISGLHLTVVPAPTGYHLWDGNLLPGRRSGRASSWGLHTTEGRAEPSTGVPLPWQSETPVWLVSSDSSSKKSLALYFASHPDPNSSFASRGGGGLVIRRGDEIDEIYVLLAGGLSSSSLPEIGANCHLRRADPHLLLDMGDGSHPLLPGKIFTLGGRPWRCTRLEQHGVPPVHHDAAT